MLDRLGFLARDNESLEEYQDRFKARESFFSKENYHRLGDLLKEKRAEELYAFSPQTIWGFFSKKNLSSWYGAMTWVMEDGTPLIQFQKKLGKKNSFLGYSLEEVGAHEAVHAFRSDFSGNRFEEILAYQTSKNKVRRIAGPLFRSPWQIRGFLLTFICPWFSPPSWILISYLIPFGYLIIQSFRLCYDYRLFKKALASLGKVFPKEKKPLTLLVRMNQEEILLFAKEKEDKIKKYIEKMGKTSLRWQQILSSCY
jgi:hypothetical protein